VLNVLATPLSRRLGGIPTQFLARLAHEEKHRATAILCPREGGIRLELTRPNGPEVTRVAVSAQGPHWPGMAGRDPVFETLVADTARRLGANVVHAEGLSGPPPESLRRLRDQGLRLVVSVHDFAAFCVRPHLIEHPLSRFCGYSRDPDRCDACLAVGTRLRSGDLARHRAAAGRLLCEADAVVFASSFLMRQHEALFPGAMTDGRGQVIEPSSGAFPLPPRGARPRRDGRVHVAFVGAVQAHKGALVFEEVVKALSDESRFRFTVLGGGDPHLAARLRALPRVAMRGYYRAGSLPGLLRDLDVDVALLLSVWPEAYGMTFDECLAAGIPTVAFDLGALADRMRATGQSRGLVPPEAGAWGVAQVLRQGAAPAAPTGPIRSATQAADSYLALYERLGYNPLPSRVATSEPSASAAIP
jgi:glycosyltransferase involved in cell wall biosynthesis